MPLFRYKVRDKYGLLIRGKAMAKDLAEISSSLGSLNYSVVDISQVPDWEEKLHHFFSQLRGISHGEMLLFIRQLASMINAGLPILTCFDNIIKQTENPSFRYVLQEIYDDISGGKSFSSSVERFPKYFSSFFVSMINVGEISGHLDEVLSRLVTISRKENEIRSRMTSALVYPVILIFLSLGIVSYLLIFVLPKFVAVYQSTGVELPMATQILLKTSSFLQGHWWLILVALGGIFYSLKKYSDSPQGRFNVDQFVLLIPIFGPLILKYNLARFSRTFGALTKSGLAVLQSLAVTEKTMNNMVLVTVVKDLRTSILEGQSLSQQLKLSGIFPPMVTQMISAGEQTGKLDEMLLEVADFYDSEVDYQIRNMTTILEPILLVLMGGIVLFMALAVLKPIFNLTSVVR